MFILFSDCREQPRVKQLRTYSLPFRTHNLPSKVSAMTGTSTGDLALVEKYGRKVCIVTTNGTVLRQITVQGASELYGICRVGGNLFFTDHGNKHIHVITEKNTHIASMYTGISHMYGLDVKGHTIWVAASFSGLYKLTFDMAYNITGSTLLVPSVWGSQFYTPFAITAVQSGLIVSCSRSDNIHFLSLNGSRLFPPVGGRGSGDGLLNYPQDIDTDGCGRVYVVDKSNNRVVLYSGAGRFITNLVAEQHGLEKAASLYVHNNVLYITNSYGPSSYNLIGVELT